ncbi:hypothetical protein TB2_008767 [Malus domestica]
MGDISLRKTGVEEKRTKAQKESNVLLDYTRRAISRLTYLKRYGLVGYVPTTVKSKVWILMWGIGFSERFKFSNFGRTLAQLEDDASQFE